MPAITATQLVHRAWGAGLRPDPAMLVSEWAEAKRVLPPTSAEPGAWRNDRTPYTKEIMDSLSPSDPTEEVIWMAGAQVGKSETGNNWIGFIIDQAPAPTLIVQPTVDTGKDYTRERINPLIKNTASIAKKVAPEKSRDSSNTTRFKEFPGGFLAITGANSAAGLSSKPIRYLFLDEIDRYPLDVDGQGDPVGLAEKRTDTFSRRKKFKTSTPTVKGFSRIESLYLTTDQRRYFVPCPHCDCEQYLKWANIKWVNNDPLTAHYVCEHCGTQIDEHNKTWMLANGTWKATANGTSKVRGYHLPSLYSPLGWRSWAAIVSDFLSAKAAADRGDNSLLKKWVNLDLGETWDEQGQTSSPLELSARAESYEFRSVPHGGLILTAAVDVQGNRLECEIDAWGRGEENWVIDYVVFHGDPSRMGEGSVWADLDEYLKQPIRHASSADLKIRACAIDSGGLHTQEVYTFCRDRDHRYIFPVKGQSQPGKPALGKPVEVEINYRGLRIKKGVRLWPMGSDTIKSLLFGRLRVKEPGAGYMHFSQDLPSDYYDQLTAERLITKYVRGRARQEWHIAHGKRNEALDLKVMNVAAAIRLGVHRMKDADWDRVEISLPVKNAAVEKVAKKIEQPPLSMAAVMRRPARGGFVNAWRR